MNFEHDALVVYLKGVSPKAPKPGENEESHPAVDLTLQIDHGYSESIWGEILHTFMGVDGEQADYVALLDALAAWLDSPVKFGRTFDHHLAKFWLSTELVAEVLPAKIHKAKIDWANDHHDTRIVFTVTGNLPGDTIGRLTEYLGQKLRLETLNPQPDMLDE